MENQIKEHEEQLIKLKASLKEKEQFSRVSTYKLNDLRRNGKAVSQIEKPGRNNVRGSIDAS